VRSYRTISPLPAETGGIFSVALSIDSRRPEVIWHLALWSPDFPLLKQVQQRLPGRLWRLVYWEGDLLQGIIQFFSKLGALITVFLNRSWPFKMIPGGTTNRLNMA